MLGVTERMAIVDAGSTGKSGAIVDGRAQVFFGSFRGSSAGYFDCAPWREMSQPSAALEKQNASVSQAQRAVWQVKPGSRIGQERQLDR